MPLYRYRCPVEECDREYDDLFFPLKSFVERIFDFCPVHGHQWFTLYLKKAAAVHDWGMGRYYEHVSHEGKTFYSKKEFKDFCKKEGISEHSSYG